MTVKSYRLKFGNRGGSSIARFILIGLTQSEEKNFLKVAQEESFWKSN